MAPWTLRTYSAPGGLDRVYDRPLGLTEQMFYWDGVCNGIADFVQHVTVDIRDRNTSPFTFENVTRAWLALKQQFPLLGSQVVERDGGKEVIFVVAEKRLEICVQGDLEFHSILSPEEAQEFVDNLISGKRLLSNERLVRLFILARTDQQSLFHVVIHTAHCIADGVASSTLMGRFLDTLTSAPSGVQWDLEERLALAVASEDLHPGLKLSLAKQRWHHAMGHTLNSIRGAKTKGGHTLPRTLTRLTFCTPARSCQIDYSLSVEESGYVLQCCRNNHTTFGNVLPVIAQVALTRLLCRRYIRGDISRNEWEYRVREPMFTGGPLSLRPYLDRQWFENGGAHNISLSINFFFHTLPFMPLGSAQNLEPGSSMPGYNELLSKGRFWLRCSSTRRQSAQLVQHPRFLDISTAGLPEIIDQRRALALYWQNERGGREERDDHIIPIAEPLGGLVMSHGGSSLGNFDRILAREYPLSRGSSMEPTIYLRAAGIRLRCRPAELYLGASMYGQRLQQSILWDKNVYNEETVREWLEEIRLAIEFYLLEGGPPGRYQAHL